VRVAAVFFALIAALALQTTLGRFTVGSSAVVDLVLVAVVFVGLTLGPVAGLFTGTFGGLAQDALSGGIIGVAGLAKTIIGFLAGVIGSQFIVQHPLPRFVVFVGGSLVNAACFAGLYMVINPGAVSTSVASATTQALVNGAVGILAFHLFELVPGVVQRRRTGRGSISRRLD
jgi:rod shape-determining protein MreD